MAMATPSDAAPPGPVEGLERRIAALDAEIAALHDDQGAHITRADSMRGLIDGVLADASTRGAALTADADRWGSETRRVRLKLRGHVVDPSRSDGS
jgi:hypothetical protein